MVESVPVVLKQGLKKDEAEKLMKQLMDAGAKVELIWWDNKKWDDYMRWDLKHGIHWIINNQS